MDTRPPTVTSRALAALSAAIELGDARQVALASFDAVLSGATRDEVEQVVREHAAAGRGHAGHQQEEHGAGDGPAQLGA